MNELNTEELLLVQKFLGCQTSDDTEYIIEQNGLNIDVEETDMVLYKIYIKIEQELDLRGVKYE